MNKLKKVLLYPTLSTIVIMLMSVLNWILIAFFAIMLDTEMSIVANSGPIVIIYVVSILSTIHLIKEVCQYVSDEL
jgi:hypothetical protein